MFQIILSGNWEDPVISQLELGKEGPKGLLHEPISVFDLIIFKFMVKLLDVYKQCLLLDEVIKRA